MVTKCANSRYFATRHDQEGKLFRLDIDLGSKAGEDQRKTEYIWLCSRCAQEMHPEVEVNGDTVTVRLLKNAPMRADATASSKQVN
jgi:hypothetical protein